MIPDEDWRFVSLSLIAMNVIGIAGAIIYCLVVR